MINNDTKHSNEIILNTVEGGLYLNHSFKVDDGIHYFKVAALHFQCGEYGCVNSTSPFISTSGFM